MHRDLISKNILALRQATDVIGRLDGRTYVETISPFTQSGVGSHFRHCIEFYNALLAGLETGRVNYDRRERNRALAGDTRLALAEIESIITRLGRLHESRGEQELDVMLEGSKDEFEPAGWSRSTAARELQFLLSHTVHHYALIAVVLRLQGVEPGEEFGVAPSTLQHWNEAELCAQ